MLFLPLTVTLAAQPSMRLPVPLTMPTRAATYLPPVMLPVKFRFLMVAPLMKRKRAKPSMPVSLMLMLMVCPLPSKVPRNALNSELLTVEEVLTSQSSLTLLPLKLQQWLM